MLAILLGLFWESLAIEQLLKQTLWVRYFTDLVWGTFGTLPVIKAMLLSLFGVQSVLDQCLKQIICVSYFTKWVWGTISN